MRQRKCRNLFLPVDWVHILIKASVCSTSLTLTPVKERSSMSLNLMLTRGWLNRIRCKPPTSNLCALTYLSAIIVVQKIIAYYLVGPSSLGPEIDKEFVGVFSLKKTTF